MPIWTHEGIPFGSGGGVTDHGALTGLGDDDHEQYLDEARGDDRYYLKTDVDAEFAGLGAMASRDTAPLALASTANGTTVANTTTPTVCFSFAFAAAALNAVGRTVRWRVWGKASTTSSPTLALMPSLDDGGSDVLIGAQIAGVRPGLNASNAGFLAEGEFTVRSTGASGTVCGVTKCVGNGIAPAVTVTADTVTVDLTGTVTFKLTATWSAAEPSNTFTPTGATFEILDPE